MENRNNELDLISLLRVMWSNKITISVLALLFGFLFFCYSYYFTDYTYTASGVLYVSSRSENATQDEDITISKTDIDTAKTLSATYIEILQTRDFLESVSELTKSKINWKKISKMLSVSIVNDTELIDISVTTNDPDLSFDIAESVISAAPTKLLSIYEAGKVNVVNKVHYPDVPNSKRTSVTTVIGFLLGLIIGTGCAFIRSLFDNKICNSTEIVNKYDVSILGELSNADPSAKSKKRKGEILPRESEKILSKKSNFDTVETYKSIRTNIMFSIPKSDKGKIITITSPAPSEGKTTTAINLAITFAQTNSKVLLIDCDLRKARVHRYLQIERGIGISNVLCGFCKLENAIKKQVRENLDVLTAGELPPNPAELLNNDEFGAVLSELQEKYDYIFIDTSPMTVVTDATIVLPKSQGVVVIVRENQTTFDLLDETMEDIKKVKTKILGVVVLDSAKKEKKYGYYKYKKYGYKYNYSYSDNAYEKK